jgi:hypothetical protein
MIHRYPINNTYRSSKKSIQSDNNQSHYSVGGVLLTERTHRQTNKQTATLIHIYNKNNILISPQTRLLICTENLYLHTLHTYKHTIQGRLPVAPRRQYTYTQYIRTDAQTRVSIFHVSIF